MCVADSFLNLEATETRKRGEREWRGNGNKIRCVWFGQLIKMTKKKLVQWCQGCT